jgi:hypothetical protein
MTQEASNQLIDKIKVILKGIDQTEIESADGWWETSTGAKFGAEALKQILELLAQTQEPWCMKMNGCKTKCEDCPDEPPQRTERPVDCERCNRLEEHAYDLIGKLRVANIKLSMQSKACVYCGQLVMEEKK